MARYWWIYSGLDASKSGDQNINGRSLKTVQIYMQVHYANICFNPKCTNTWWCASSVSIPKGTKWQHGRNMTVSYVYRLRMVKIFWTDWLWLACWTSGLSKWGAGEGGWSKLGVFTGLGRNMMILIHQSCRGDTVLVAWYMFLLYIPWKTSMGISNGVGRHSTSLELNHY
jgi:hypothetical protein